MRNDVDDALLVLQFAGHADKARAEYNRAKDLEGAQPHDRIGNAGLVLERHENRLGVARSLTYQHKAGDGDDAAGGYCWKLLVAQNSAGFELRPYKCERMRLERQMQGAIVLDDVLARPHRRQ